LAFLFGKRLLDVLFNKLLCQVINLIKGRPHRLFLHMLLEVLADCLKLPLELRWREFSDGRSRSVCV
jgi:hypothetical protein